jgi:CDP-diacylglycerol--serine O-phosphatidyltransferase
MAEKKISRRHDLPIINLLPNLLTIIAICAGLTAIRFGYQGNFERAVQLILLASVLDGVDGRLARLLKCESEMGAELDSLADFVNFGIAPGLMLYVWTLQDLRGAGWISVLIFTICCVIRLARFNVSTKSEFTEKDSRYFVGVPAPAGAMLALLPMFLSFLFTDEPLFPPNVTAFYVIIIGLLMISRIPTWSFKIVTIRRERTKFLYLGFVVIVAALFTYPWATLVILDLAYIAGVIWAWRTGKINNKLDLENGN